MDPIIVASLIKNGFELASEAFAYLRENDERNAKNQHDIIAAHEETQLRIIKTLEATASAIHSASAISVGKIIDKLESDNLERLFSRIKSAKLALEMDNREGIQSLLGDLLELTDYGKNRILEGKRHWLGAWITGESLRIALLKSVASSPKVAAIAAREAQSFRLSLLDMLGAQLLSQNGVPWTEIADFVKGENEAIVGKLLAIALAHSSAQASRLTAIAQAPIKESISSHKKIPTSTSVPGGRKTCRACRHIEFERYIECPNCGANGTWWQ